MKFVFLDADGVSLTKHITLENGTLHKTAYPQASRFTSHEETHTTLTSLHDSIQRHAGHALLKGLIARPLVCESRAGSTDSNTLTGWVCLDLDGAPYESIEAFMKEIGLENVSYLWQMSASAGFSPGLRAHVFVFLDRPQHPALLKVWLKHLNLSIPSLTKAVSLTKNNSALVWPLDITTCQNDKLIYISPPTLGEGVEDPVPVRSGVVLKQHHTMSLPPNLNPGSTQQIQDKLINQLRRDQGLSARKFVYKTNSNDEEYLSKPDQAVVTSTKQERGFTYLNLNGGDSFAYWHPDENFEFIYNFKGEPVYKTEELDPTYYARCKRTAQRKAAEDNPKVLMAFRDFVSSQYFNGWYDTSTDELVLHMARSETQIRDFMALMKMPETESIPIWSRVFDPHEPTVVDLQAKPYPTVNIFKPSKYMTSYTPTKNARVPPVCQKILLHVIGDNPELMDHFHNWVACIMQHLDRTMTGWILHGTQGTGKGLLINKVLAPLLGFDNITMKRMEELESEFTGFFENVFIVVIDEVQTSASLQSNKVVNKLKNLMVEPTISVRRMYREPYMARNYSNMIFTSNATDPIVVPPDDRRFNVADFQTKPIQITSEEIDQLEGELAEMYAFWMQYPADRERAKTVLKTKGRAELISTNMAASDAVALALQQGDLQFFVDQLPTSELTMTHMAPSLNGESVLGSRHNQKVEYIKLVRSLVHSLETRLTRDELHLLFQYTVGNCPETPNKFTAYLRHHRIHLSAVWRFNKTVRGLVVNWKADPEWLARTRQELA